MQSSRLTQEPVLLSIKTFPGNIDVGVFFLAVTSADGLLKRVLRFSTDEKFSMRLFFFHSFSTAAEKFPYYSRRRQDGAIRLKGRGLLSQPVPHPSHPIFHHHPPPPPIYASTNKGAASTEAAFFTLRQSLLPIRGLLTPGRAAALQRQLMARRASAGTV